MYIVHCIVHVQYCTRAREGGRADNGEYSQRESTVYLTCHNRHVSRERETITGSIE